MIELNLLPDVKQEYLRTQRIKRLSILVSLIISAAAITILVMLVVAEGWQKHTLGNINKDVSSKTTTLKNEAQINSILTVQNQLQSVNGLHDSKPATTRLFDYLNELTPLPASINTLKVDFALHTISITGDADALSTVNQYIDTLKFTKYDTGQHTVNKPAFSDVVLSSFQYDTTTSPPASFTIEANFDPIIFYITKNVALVIPSTITTRANLEHPKPLFVQNPSQQSGTTTNSSSVGGN
jgi:hypothetical protein